MAVEYVSKQTLGYLVQTIDDNYVRKTGIKIEKLTTAEDGYAASYQLKVGDTVAGDTINIPKDYFLKDSNVKVCETENQPITGLKVGDKYIDLEVNVTDGTEDTVKHNYIAIKDVVAAYSQGNGIEIDADNTIKIKIDTTNANGLVATEDGIKLNEVSEDGAGAMTPEMLELLNGAVQEEDLEDLLPDIEIGDATGDGNVITGITIDPNNSHKIIPTMGKVALEEDDFEEITEGDIDDIWSGIFS